MMKKPFQTIEQGIDALYSNKKLARDRFDRLLDFGRNFTQENKDIYFFSAPGRIELCGNHTDHQGGKVLSAAIEQDLIAQVTMNDQGMVNIHSMNQRQFSVPIYPAEPHKNERGKSAAMVRGIIAGFAEIGVNTCGLDICIMSNVLSGSGMSSSAAFETLIATIIDALCNEGETSPTEIARICQYAESHYFGKPCGLMDQLTCAYGGCVAIDFSGGYPKIIQTDITKVLEDYAVYVVHTGGSHAKLNTEYSSIVKEMSFVARYFGKNILSEVPEDEFFSRLPEIRKSINDRPILRAIHYFRENKRVEQALTAIENKNTTDFFAQINDSGDSSTLLLQNVYLDHVHNKSIALALAMTKEFLKSNGALGGCRIHGGGFLGTILAFVPRELSSEYEMHINKALGDGAAQEVRIRKYGATVLTQNR